MNHIHPIVAIAPVVVTDGSAQTSVAIDLQGYNSCTFIIAVGTLEDTDATWSVEVSEGDTNVVNDHTAVVDKELVGTEADAGFTFEDDGETRKIGYVGNKRYVSIEIDDVVANTGNAPLSVIAILGHPNVGPTTNPPA